MRRPSRPSNISLNHKLQIFIIIQQRNEDAQKKHELLSNIRDNLHEGDTARIASVRLERSFSAYSEILV